jgi:hypothetical protein
MGTSFGALGVVISNHRGLVTARRGPRGCLQTPFPFSCSWRENARATAEGQGADFIEVMPLKTNLKEYERRPALAQPGPACRERDAYALRRSDPRAARELSEVAMRRVGKFYEMKETLERSLAPVARFRRSSGFDDPAPGGMDRDCPGTNASGPKSPARREVFRRRNNDMN